MLTLWRDVLHGFKLLFKNPGFTAAAVFSLALGIGLNSTIFCIVDRLILQPLPVDHPEELVLLRIRTDNNRTTDSLTHPEYLELRDQCKSLAGIAGSQRHGAILSGGDVVEMVLTEYVTRNYFSVLGVKAQVGRVFSESDRGDSGVSAVVISDRFWRHRFGGDPGIAGKTIELTRRQVTVLGVAPRGFHGTQRPVALTDVWYPADQTGSVLTGPKAEEFELIGRLAGAASIEQAQAEVDTIVRRLSRSNPSSGRIVGAGLFLEARRYRDTFGTLGLLLMAIAGLILLIACVNVSNLLLARSQSRRKEIAIRLALGGSRLRLTRQLLTESLVLSLVAGGCGLLLTRWAMKSLPALLPPTTMPAIPEIGPDIRVLAFAIVLSLLATLIFALIPALQASRIELAPMLNESAGAGSGGRRYLGRSALVVGQLCISLVLLTQSGLLIRSFIRGLHADVGFEKKDVLLARFALGIYEYDEGRARAFYQSLTERVLALPGVRLVSLARRVPLSTSGGGFTRPVFFPGDKDGQNIKCNIIASDYLRTMGIRILLGRDLTPQDISAGARVLLVNEAFVRRFWPGGEPVGQLIRVGDALGVAYSVVGVVRDGPIVTIGEEPEPYMYLPLNRGYAGELTLLAECTGDPGAVAGSFRQAVRAIDKNVAPLRMSTLKNTVREGLYDRELMAYFMGAFGLLGLILASFGLYGIVSYSVSQRTREIGLRMALGAQRADALRMVLRHGLLLALSGMALGLPLSLIAAWQLRGALYQVSAADPLSIGGTALLLVCVALLASYIPARRATSIDPMVALRPE